jgi:hypothetical protein
MFEKCELPLFQPQPTMLKLESGDAIETGVFGKAVSLAKAVKASVLPDAKDADRTGSRIQGVKELAISTDSNIEVRASTGIDSYDCSVERRQGPGGADCESGDCGGRSVRGVNPSAIRRDGIPFPSVGTPVLIAESVPLGTTE